MSCYSELLKDPRWQKRRLEIMERDNFTCQVCNCSLNDGIPLHVHHIVYREGHAPWDYRREELITLCESCHQKVHNNEIDIKVHKMGKRETKIIFYRYFLQNRNELNYGDTIVLSYLLYVSIFKIGWDENANTFCTIFLRDEILKNINIGIGDFIPLQDVTISSIAKHTEITRQNINRIIKKLKDNGYIVNGYIKCPIKLLEEGFIKLPEDTGLKGIQLIFYGYILERSKRYNGSIDTYAVKLAEKLGITRTNVHSILSILNKKGYVMRDRSTNRLIVL